MSDYKRIYKLYDSSKKKFIPKEIFNSFLDEYYLNDYYFEMYENNFILYRTRVKSVNNITRIYAICFTYIIK